ncbi:uncharacterized protein LOC113358979 [Papaver somniferum]|uniref:uncharacterized protein LOC113358979 n=1 Tax=Papaver somniferum TaxID=3469 RepID=UPI000E6FE271|nr:uncharacterized protein LOC113358979 [Papaver somniferum]
MNIIMARLLVSLVLLMMSVSQIAFAEDLKLGRKARLVEVERHGSVGQSLSNGQVKQGGANNVAVAGGLINPAGGLDQLSRSLNNLNKIDYRSQDQVNNIDFDSLKADAVEFYARIRT